MKTIHNYKVFLITVLLVLGTVSQTIKAQGNEWKSTIVYPGSKKLLSASPNFTGCFTVDRYAQKKWFRCTDVDGKSPMSFETVWNTVRKDYSFTLSKPGYCYYVFETKVSKETFYYGDPTVSVSMMGKDGKWQSVWIRGSVYSTNYHGAKPKNTPNKFTYKINQDGTLKFWTTPPYYLPGRYKITVVSATRFNNNTAEKTYVQSSASLKIYFIEKGTIISKNYNKPKPGILYYTDKKCQ